MFIAVLIVLIALVVVGYFPHLKRYCRAFRQTETHCLSAEQILKQYERRDSRKVE